MQKFFSSPRSFFAVLRARRLAAVQYIYISYRYLCINNFTIMGTVKALGGSLINGWWSWTSRPDRSGAQRTTRCGPTVHLTLQVNMRRWANLPSHKISSYIYTFFLCIYKYTTQFSIISAIIYNSKFSPPTSPHPFSKIKLYQKLDNIISNLCFERWKFNTQDWSKNVKSVVIVIMCHNFFFPISADAEMIYTYICT